MKVDRTACIGIGNRQGVGKVRHLDTRRLWLEERVQCGQAWIEKCSTEENIADIGTKPLNGNRLQVLALAAGQWTPEDGEAGDNDDDFTKKRQIDDRHVGNIIRSVVSSLCM